MRLFLISLLFFALSAVWAPAQSRPNVVMIVSDDQAWTDYGFMGHPVIRTPHLDRLAARSLVFPRGYVPTALCRPSLATMITGLYPHQHGITGNDAIPKFQDWVQRAARDKPFQERFKKLGSLPRLLARHGYVSFQSGKWWEGSCQNGGFTAGMTHGDPQRGGRHGDAGLRIGRNTMKPLFDFIDEAVADETPFFIWYAPFLPHTPHNPPKELLAKYLDPDRPIEEARYFAMCEWFDRTCGVLLGYLEQKKLTKDTLVAYVCDNGWVADTDASKRPTGWGKRNYAPRSKASPYEGGIRTPIMFSLPGRIVPKRAQDLASSIDLAPTILALCGLEAPGGLPGINLADAKARGSRTTLFGEGYSVTHMILGDPPATRQYRWCIDGPWKLLIRDRGELCGYAWTHEWDTEPMHLYNLEEDPHEALDLAGQQPKTVTRLRSMIEKWLPTRP